MKFGFSVFVALGCVPLAASRGLGQFLGRHVNVRGNNKLHDITFFLDRLANCRSDPQSCSDVTDDSKDFSDSMQDRVIDEMNESQGEFDNYSFEFEACDSHRGDVDSYRSSFSAQVITHTQCRELQEKDESAAETCEQLEDSNEKLKDAECNSDKLTEPADDMADICKPANGELLGPWLESLMETFTTKYNEWNTQDQKCTGAIWKLGNSTERCSEVRKNVTEQTSECDGILTGIESFACAWATDSGNRCSAYETCFRGVSQRYTAEVAALPAKIQQWKETWIAAEKVKCMADAIDSSGVVDTVKMDKCNDDSSFDTSHIKVTVPELPQQEACAVPEIYPGSALYRSEVYNPLPDGVQIREPTLCLSWKGGCAAHSTFDGAAVFLKVNDKYCSLTGTKMVCDNSKTQEFVFRHKSDDCTGDVSLSSYVTEAKCQYEPTYDGLQIGVQCGAGTGRVNSPYSAKISSNPPATGRSGEVSLTFGGVQGGWSQVMSVQSWTGLNALDSYSSVTCSGFLKSMWSQHNNGKEDRQFKYRCAQPQQGFGNWNPFGTFGTSLQTSWQVLCPSGAVMSRVSSSHNNDREDRSFVFGCSTVPKGLAIYRGGFSGWAGTLDGLSNSDSVCSGSQVISGVKSQFSNKKEDRVFAFQCASITARQPPSINFKVEYAPAKL